MVSFSIEGVLTKLQYYTSTKLYRFKKLDKKYKNNDIVQDTSLKTTAIVTGSSRALEKKLPFCYQKWEQT
jgi:hypothetical protein